MSKKIMESMLPAEEALHCSRVLEAIDRVSKQKNRPNIFRVYRYLYRNYMMSAKSVIYYLHCLLRQGKVVEVVYKGEASYRNVGSGKKYNGCSYKPFVMEPSSPLSTVVAQLTVLHQEYFQNGVPVQALQNECTNPTFSPTKLTKSEFTKLLSVDLSHEVLIELPNGNLFFGPLPTDPVCYNVMSDDHDNIETDTQFLMTVDRTVDKDALVESPDKDGSDLKEDDGEDDVEPPPRASPMPSDPSPSSKTKAKAAKSESPPTPTRPSARNRKKKSIFDPSVFHTPVQRRKPVQPKFIEPKEPKEPKESPKESSKDKKTVDKLDRLDKSKVIRTFPGPNNKTTASKFVPPAPPPESKDKDVKNSNSSSTQIKLISNASTQNKSNSTQSKSISNSTQSKSISNSTQSKSISNSTHTKLISTSVVTIVPVPSPPTSSAASCVICRIVHNKKLEESVISCSYCSSKAHPGCAEEIRRDGDDAPWCCMRCIKLGKRVCASCLEPIKKGNVLFCGFCHDFYHHKCQPSHVYGSKKWRCYSCRKSGVRTPILQHVPKKKSVPKPPKPVAKCIDDVENLPVLNFNPAGFKNAFNLPEVTVSLRKGPVPVKKHKPNEPETDTDNNNVPDSPNPLTWIDQSIPDATDWTSADVYNYFSKYFPEDIAHVFKEQEIDGIALLLMRKTDVLENLKLNCFDIATQVLYHVRKLQIRREDLKLICFQDIY